MVQGIAKTLPLRDIPKKLGVILLLFTFLSFGQLLDRVVANVNGEHILESELKIARMFYGISNRKELIEKLIEKHMIAQFLKKNGLNIPDDYIESVIHDIAKSNNKSVEEFYRELYKEGLTPEDLRNFLRVEIASTLGLREYLMGKIEVSEIEIELERLKRGEVQYLKEVELLIVGKEKKGELLRIINEKGTDLKGIAEVLGLKVERLKVRKGELVEPLDREIWKADVGQVAIAEDKENIYMAKVLRNLRIFSGRSEEEIKKEIIQKKLKRNRKRY